MLVMSKYCDILHLRGKLAGYHQYVVLSRNHAWCADKEASLSSNTEYIYLLEHLNCTFLTDTTVAMIQSKQLDKLLL